MVMWHMGAAISELSRMSLCSLEDADSVNSIGKLLVDILCESVNLLTFSTLDTLRNIILKISVVSQINSSWIIREAY